MYWDGPMNGTSDCTPRLTQLLEYAVGSQVPSSGSVITPWSGPTGVNTTRKFTVLSAVSLGLNRYQLTTDGNHGLTNSSLFTISGFLPVAWNGIKSVYTVPAANILIFSNAVTLQPATLLGEISYSVPAVIGSIYPAHDCVIEFPAGLFSFNTQPPALPQCTIRGQGKLSTIFIKRFNGGTLFQQTGERGDGLILERFSALTDPAYSPGYFCFLSGRGNVANPYAGNVVMDLQPDNFQIKDIYISQYGSITGGSPPGGGLWQNGIVVDGSARTHPQGIRIGLIENCEIFNCMSFGVYIKNGVGITMRGGGTFPGSASIQYPQGTQIGVAGTPPFQILGFSGPTGGIASLTTNGNHQVGVGDTFIIAGCSPSGWNGTFTATSGTGLNQINFALGGSPGGATILGTVSNPLLRSNNCHFQGIANNCQLNIALSDSCTWMGGTMGGLVTDATSTHWMVHGVNSGSTTNNLISSSVILT